MSQTKTKPQNSRDLAKFLNQTLVVRIFGPMYGVYYPYRRSGDLYVAIDGHPVHCCQCEKDIPVDASLKAWIEHIRGHSKRKLIKPIIMVAKTNDGQLVATEEVI